MSRDIFVTLRVPKPECFGHYRENEKYCPMIKFLACPIGTTQLCKKEYDQNTPEKVVLN